MPALADLASTPLSSLIDLNFLLINRIVALLLTLLFFSVVLMVRRSRGQKIYSNIKAPIKLSMFGLLLLGCEMMLSHMPSYRAILGQLQIIVVLLCLAKLVIYVFVDIYLRLQMRRDVPSFIRDAVCLVVYLAVGILSLRLVFKIDLSAIVTTTTVITATIAFAMQSTLANALSGFSIQTDKLLDRHNWISIKEKDLFGEIVNVGFRYTTLRTLENTLQMVPNSVIMQSVVTYYGNSSTDDKPANQLEIMLGYDMPPAMAKDLLVQLLIDEPQVLKIPEPVVRLQALNDSGITYLLKFWIEDPSQINVIRNEIFTRAWYSVNRAGYSFPYPHRQVINSEPCQPLKFSRDGVAADLLESEVFAVLDEVTAVSLAEKANVMVFGVGEVVIRQGDVGNSLFIVLKGELDAIVDGVTAGTIKQHSIFGEMSLLTGDPRRATVRVSSEAWLAEISKDHLEQYLRLNPSLLEKLSAILAERERLDRELSNVDNESAGDLPINEEYLLKLKNFFRL